MAKFKGSNSSIMLSEISMLLLFFLFYNTLGIAQTPVDIQQEITPLYEITSNLDSNKESALNGDTVTVTGIANIGTGILHENYLQVFIQNDSTGISLFAESYDKDIHLGDSMVATGVVQEYYGMTELKVLEYSIFTDSGKEPLKIPLYQAVDNLPKYEGMLISGTGEIVDKGDRFNGKYLMVTPFDRPNQPVMVYVTNFHSMYQQFDFESLSVGDELRITGVLSLYNPDSKGEEESTYKIHLRVPEDISAIGITRSQMIFWGTLGLIVALLVIGWIISLRSRVQSKTSDLKQSLDDKEVLLKEIHHRVKNNLAIMSGLFELQLDGTENEETKEVLLNGQSRLKSMALVHDKLYRTSTLTDIEMSQYVTELVRSLRNTFTSTNQDIKLKFSFDDIYLDIDQAIPCGLLINEIVVNAFKHAFKNKDSGLIKISMKRKNGRVKLIIADNGEGIPEDFDIQKSSSLGMMLIETFKNQLGAGMEVSNLNGTKFSLNFPVE